MNELQAIQALPELRGHLRVLGQQPGAIRMSAGLEIGQIPVEDTGQVGQRPRRRLHTLSRLRPARGVRR